MAPKIEKRVVEIVTLDSSDDEDENIINKNTTINTSNAVVVDKSRKTPILNAPPPPQQQNNLGALVSPLQNQNTQSRSFWKAGDYAIGPTSKSLSAHGSLEHARVHPKFLHSNATSHKWAFGAIAELIDNAVDEVNNGATFVNVDKIEVTKDMSPALLIQDDGGGMDPEGIRKCMSLGYSSKKSNTTIGQYGNGFKTSTMRLGADAIVFTRAIQAGKATQSVGLLSYTFLRKTGQDDVIVPMVDFDISSNWAEPIVYGSEDDWSSNLKTILEWSPFASKEELMQQFEGIEKHGTKVIIYNLWLNDEGVYELSFDDEEEDICLRDEASSGNTNINTKRAKELRSHISYRIRYSLRAYASILYLKKFKNFKIVLRGKPVEQFNIADELQLSKIVTYKPTGKEDTVETKIGFIKEGPNLPVSGFNVYHKNRLIRPFWKVTPDGTSRGHGVVGVLEANFIEPAHDKQDFERSLSFVRLETRLKQMIYDYWKGHCHLMGYKPQDNSVLQMMKTADQAIDEPVMGRQTDAETSRGSTCDNVSQPISIDQLCDENIKLFMRCEEHMQEEAQLEKQVQDLESELEQAKRKYAKLAMIVETKKKQKGLA